MGEGAETWRLCSSHLTGIGAFFGVGGEGGGVWGGGGGGVLGLKRLHTGTPPPVLKQLPTDYHSTTRKFFARGGGRVLVLGEGNSLTFWCAGVIQGVDLYTIPYHSLSIHSPNSTLSTSKLTVGSLAEAFCALLLQLVDRIVHDTMLA